MVNWKKLFADLFIGLVLAFMYLPLLFVIVYSFSGNSRFVFDSFTFDSYVTLFTNPPAALINALKNTLIIAAISSVISTFMGTCAAIGIFHMSKKARRVVEGVNQLPVINSEIVMAVSLLLFFNAIRLPEGYVRLIIAHTAFCTPYVVLSVMPKLVQMDPNVYEAALDLGATPGKALFSVMIPIISPGIVSGFVMAFTLSMDDFIITQINKGATTSIDTLSTYIYGDAIKGGLQPFWLALFSVIFVVVLGVILLVNLKKKNDAACIAKVNKAIRKSQD